MGRKLIKAYLLGVLGAALLFSSANAALFTASMDSTLDSVDAPDIAAFTIWLDVQEGFLIENPSTESAVPTEWLNDSNLGTVVPESGKNVAKFGSSDFSAILGVRDLIPLGSGDLFSFEYTGTINDLFLVKFATLTDPDVFDREIFLQSFDSNSAVFTAVPIPSALLLLGGGLIGLLGIRRKISVK